MSKNRWEGECLTAVYISGEIHSGPGEPLVQEEGIYTIEDSGGEWVADCNSQYRKLFVASHEMYTLLQRLIDSSEGSGDSVWAIVHDTNALLRRIDGEENDNGH